MFSAPEIDQGAGNDQNDDRQNGSFDTKPYIISEAVSGRGSIQLKDRVGNYDTAVGKSKQDILGEVPCGMYRKGTPETVHIIDYEYKQNAGEEEVEQRQEGYSVIHKVQQGKKQGAADDGNCRMPVILSKLLVQESAAEHLFSGGLYKNAKKDCKEGYRVKGIEGKPDILVQPCAQYADPIQHESYQKSKQQTFPVVSGRLCSKVLQNVTVRFDQQEGDDRQNPDTDEQYIS